MASAAAARRMVTRPEESFPTEWAPYYGDGSNAGWQVQQSEEVRPEDPAVSSTDAIKRPAIRETATLDRQISGAA